LQVKFPCLECDGALDEKTCNSCWLNAWMNEWIANFQKTLVMIWCGQGFPRTKGTEPQEVKAQDLEVTEWYQAPSFVVTRALFPWVLLFPLGRFVTCPGVLV
jgi:hypothetical protein